MFKYIIKLLFPNTCGYCNKVLKSGYICEKCKSEIKKYEVKSKILKPTNQYFDEIMCKYEYTEIIRKKILEYKFKDKKYLCKTFVENITDMLYDYKDKFDIIIPVPISIKRKFERGYNQSLLICKEISKIINKKVVSNVLIKFKNTQAQSMLCRNARIKNVEHVYKVKNTSSIIGKNILLIDDIYTTGSTVNECSKLLKKAGANKIIVFTIARSKLQH